MRDRIKACDTACYTAADAGLALIEKLRALVALGKQGDYYGHAIVVDLDPTRHYYVQFAVDDGGLFCETVHNKYLEPQHTRPGDEVAHLLALGFAPPEHEAQNFFRVFRPDSDDDYADIVGLVRAVSDDYFGLPPTTPLRVS